MSLEIAIDNAARQAIRYMKTAEKRTPKESQHGALENEKKNQQGPPSQTEKCRQKDDQQN